VVVPVEDDAEHLSALHHVERLAHQPAWRVVGRHHEEEAVHPMSDDPAILDRA
jgi:hypothetical protein